MRRWWVLPLAFLGCVQVGAQQGESSAPGFATCAAYYFLTARGHGMQDYDRLYSAGETSLNEAVRRHGKQAHGLMETRSTGMLQAIGKDWRRVDELDRDYGAACETLLREAGHEFR